MFNLSVILIVSIILLPNNLIEACSCSKHDWKPFLPRISFLSYLSNFRKLDSLSLIGSHSSFSYLIDEKLLQTQDFDVERQIKYGVRVLDIGVCPMSGSFEIYVGDTSVNISFDDMLKIVNGFLDDNPWEFVIILIHQAHASAKHSRNNCRVLNQYLTQENGRRLVTKWQLNDTIGLHRGKILMASLDSKFRDCAFPVRDNCLVNDDEDVDQEAVVKIGALAKWISMCEFSRTIARKASECYFNDVSFAYEGSLDRKTLARESGYRNNDNSCSKPLNLQAIELYKKPTKGMLIMINDFLVQELIDKINDGNYGDSSWRSGWE